MKRTAITAALAIVLASTVTPPAAMAATPLYNCDHTERWELAGKDGTTRIGSFDVTSVSGSLSGVTAAPGRATAFLSVPCGRNDADPPNIPGTLNEDANMAMIVGDYRFSVYPFELADRTGSQYVLRGEMSVTQVSTGKIVIDRLSAQVTVRDRDDRAYVSGTRPGDSIKVEIFARDALNVDGFLPMQPPAASPLMIIKGAVWGNKITSEVTPL